VKKLILHIGLERTGTTSIQKTLKKNCPTLEKNGFAYIACENYNSTDLAYVFGTNRNFDFAERFGISGRKIENKIKEILEEYTNSILHFSRLSSIKTLIMSSEHFSSRVTAIGDINLFKEFLDRFCLDVEIILVTRDQDEIISSLYSVAMVAGHSIDYLAFCKLIANDQRYCPHENIIEKWSAVFANRITVLKYGENSTKSFLNKIGLSELNLIEIVDNASLGPKKIRILRIINRLFPNYKSWSEARRKSSIGNALRKIVLWI